MSLRRNTLWNIAGAGAPFLLGVVTIPYLLKTVGVEAFGILSLVWTMIGYFSFFDFGLGRALTQQVATNRAKGKIEELPNLVMTGLIFTFATGIVGGGVLAVLANPLGFKWLKVSVALQQSTIQSLLIASFGIPMTTLTAGLKGVLEAYEDFKAVNLLRLFLGLANFGLPVLSIFIFGPSLAMMVVSLIIARLVVLFAHLYLVYIKLPAGWLSAKFNKNKMKQLISFGSWMTVSNIVSPLMVVADRFIISSVAGASVVAYYTVPADFLIRILIIPGALAAALFPRLTSLTSTDRQEAKNVYEHSLKITTLTMLPICLGVASFSYWGLWFWLGEGFAQHSWKITSILSFGLLMNSIAQIPFAAVQARGNVKATAFLHLCEFAFYLPLLFVFLHYFGLIGAAIVWVIRTGVDLMVLFLIARRANE
jgi:O-antigen/teichoic acid export membrane protein